MTKDENTPVPYFHPWGIRAEEGKGKMEKVKWKKPGAGRVIQCASPNFSCFLFIC
jgi:hypothetical protein